MVMHLWSRLILANIHRIAFALLSLHYDPIKTAWDAAFTVLITATIVLMLFACESHERTCSAEWEVGKPLGDYDCVGAAVHEIPTTKPSEDSE